MNDPYPVGSDHAGFALKEAVKGLSEHHCGRRPTLGSTFWSSAVDSRVAGQGHFRSSADASGRGGSAEGTDILADLVSVVYVTF
jgi:hypothetical protein